MGNSNPRNRRRQRGDDDGTSDSDFILETVSSDDDGSDGFDPDNIYDADNVYPDEEEAYIPRRPKKKRIRSKKKGEDPSLNLKWMKLEHENEEWIDNQEQNTEEDDRPLLETANPSPAIVLPLLRFQKEFLAWALKQEQSEVRGGILADEMGMGKTIQAISLVLTSRGQKSNVGNLEASSSSRNGATLVICPVVAVIQWVGEIERYTEKGSVRVLVYHGPNRVKGDYDFSKYDFVITTYQTIEWDYRKNVMPEGKECRYCGKKYSVKSMRVHLLYHCGPNARKTEKQAKQKKKRKDDFENGKLKKGKNKQEKKKKKKKNVDDNGDKPWNGPKRVSLLHSVKWERIILDEAHFIKDRNSNTARAVFALDSVYKWALSGTPLQNRVGELYSLVRFLQVYPYANYFCKSCDCNIFDHNASGSRSCLNCPHSITRHFCWWNRYINKPIQCGVLDDRKRAMILLKGKVLKSIVLRRTKKGRAADLALPPRITCLRRDYLDKSEKEIYEAIYTQSRVQFDAYVGTGTLMNNYAHIFDLLTRLRQALDHPYLVVYSKTAGLVKEGEESTATGDCGICHDPPEDVVVTSCDHVFCKACLIDYSASLGNVSCPSCSKPLTVDLTANNSGQKNSAMAVKGFKRSGIMNRIKIADFKTSTKIDALREEIRNMVENDSSAKGIVFSQFTSFLDLISFSLQMSGIKCVQLVGSMSLAEREKVIKSFTEDGECRIFLMSLKAGGVALNLTAASHVFLMDPWWNPAVERQAQDRIHRIGQYKPIRTIRFVIEDTIEERILKLQEKKELVFEGTVGDSKDALSKLTEADLRFLFQN